MKRVSVVAGDIVLVPTESFGFGVAKVIYVSHVFRNLILLGIYRAIVPKPEAPASVPEKFAVPCIYTGSQRIKTGEWPIVARTQVTDEERELSRRIVGGHVWLADQCVRDATPEDRASLPARDAWHCGVVVEKVEAVVASIREGDAHQA